MIKRILYFGSPAYLALKQRQLEIRQTPDEGGATSVRTHRLLDALLSYNCAVVTCSMNHLPSGLLLPLDGHSLQNERFRAQLEASVPLRKRLWQQTIQARYRAKQEYCRMS